MCDCNYFTVVGVTLGWGVGWGEELMGMRIERERERDREKKRVRVGSVKKWEWIRG